MGIFFLWDRSYSVGNTDIDRQHKYMFELANSIDTNLRGSNAKNVIMILYKYTRKHFSSEEAMMQAIGYPKLQEHRTLHDALIDNLNNLALQPFDTEESVTTFREFIYKWLIEHIMNHDKQYALYVHDYTPE